MTSPWIAEQTVDAGLAIELIESQFPELAPARVELLGVGWDNTAFLVNGEIVFRFPRREIAVDLLVAETRVLPAIAPLLPLSVPVPRFVGRPEPRFTWPFAGYPMLPGRTACRAALSDAERVKLAEPLARFLAALHAIPTGHSIACGVLPDRLGRLDVERRVPAIRERLRQIAGLGLIRDEGAWNEILEEAGAVDRKARAELRAANGNTIVGTLVHGDLYARHLLVDEAGRLTGAIDWGDIHLGDPAIDLSLACGFLPPPARDAFVAAYGLVDPATWRLARFKALLTAVMLVVYGHDVGDSDLQREGLTTLGYLQRM